jgi:hypothetical protein
MEEGFVKVGWKRKKRFWNKDIRVQEWGENNLNSTIYNQQ